MAALLMAGGMASHAFAGSKKTAAPLEKVETLSYNDSRRYDYFFLEALRQQYKGNADAAFDLLNHCLQINPNSAEVYYRRAMFLSQMKQDSLALVSLEHAAALSPSNDTYQEKVAQFYIGTGNFGKAVDAYERLYANNRDRTDVLNVLVQLYKQQGDYPSMLKAINRMEQAEGTNEQFALAKMSVYEMMGDKKKAYATLRGLADSHPNDPNYTIMLGNWLMQKGRNKEAGKIFTQVLKADPDNTYAQSSMYDYYRATGRDSLARQMMSRMLLDRSTPTATRVQFLKQAIQENEQQGGDSLKMVALFNNLQHALPKDTTVAEMRVAYYTLKKMPVQMVDSALVQLLALAPDNAGARFQLIQNKWSGRNWKEIAELSEPGMLYNPDEMAFYYFTGLARYYQKDDNGALDALQRGTSVISDKSNPDIVSDFYAIMGEIYHNKGMNEKAYAAFDSCLQWKPDQIMTLNNYAYFLSVDGKDLTRAEQMSAKTIKAEPKNATYLDTYAWILYKQGRYTEARLYIDQALANAADTALRADVLEHAGDIYLAAGQTRQAVEFWRQALKLGGDSAALNKKILGASRTNQPYNRKKENKP